MLVHQDTPDHVVNKDCLEKQERMVMLVPQDHKVYKESKVILESLGSLAT